MSQLVFERIYSPSVEYSNIMNAIACKECKQKDVAHFYMDVITCERKYPKQINVAAINKAIIGRWPKGLERVKEMAWKLLEERHGKHLSPNGQ